MNLVISNIKPSIKILVSNKANALLALAPIFIGILAYYFLGLYFYEFFVNKGTSYINSQFQQQGDWSSYIYYVLAILLTIILYFVVNWTFIIFVSVIASPFNDLLSARIEKQIMGSELTPMSESLRASLKKIFWTIGNEIKKVFFIGFIAFIGIVLSYIPFLTPLSLVISALLLSSQFLDYSWARNELSLSNCIDDLRRNFFYYGLMGFIFFFVISIPIVNLIVPPLATSFFTILWVKLNKKEGLVENSRQVT
mgnify:FL=1